MTHKLKGKIIKSSDFSAGLREFIQWWMIPIVRKYKQPEVSIKDFLEYLFDPKRRYIDTYRAISGFQMPGKIWVLPRKKHPSTDRGGVKIGDYLFVRIDEKKPKLVDISVQDKKTNQEKTFTISNFEWSQIQRYIKLVSES